MRAKKKISRVLIVVSLVAGLVTLDINYAYSNYADSNPVSIDDYIEQCIEEETSGLEGIERLLTELFFLPICSAAAHEAARAAEYGYTRECLDFYDIDATELNRLFNEPGSFVPIDVNERSWHVDAIHLRDLCTFDRDGDTYYDFDDNCPGVQNLQTDSDGDGEGDVCDEDPCPDGMAFDDLYGECYVVENWECVESADCDGNEICTDHECVAESPCSDDSDCSDNEVCAAGSCVEVFECSSDDDCDAGEECTEGECVSVADETCTETETVDMICPGSDVVYSTEHGEKYCPDGKDPVCPVNSEKKENCSGLCVCSEGYEVGGSGVCIGIDTNTVCPQGEVFNNQTQKCTKDLGEMGGFARAKPKSGGCSLIY